MAFTKILAKKYPESFDPNVPEKLVYSGSRLLTEKIEGSKLDIGNLVLSPTRTYAPVVQKIFEEVSDQVNFFLLTVLSHSKKISLDFCFSGCGQYCFGQGFQANHSVYHGGWSGLDGFGMFSLLNFEGK
mgnify:CR=1 FL=1